jgi:hypothetical protein
MLIECPASCSPVCVFEARFVLFAFTFKTDAVPSRLSHEPMVPPVAVVDVIQMLLVIR